MLKNSLFIIIITASFSAEDCLETLKFVLFEFFVQNLVQNKLKQSKKKGSFLMDQKCQGMTNNDSPDKTYYLTLFLRLLSSTLGDYVETACK